MGCKVEYETGLVYRKNPPINHTNSTVEHKKTLANGSHIQLSVVLMNKILFSIYRENAGETGENGQCIKDLFQHLNQYSTHRFVQRFTERSMREILLTIR